MKKISTIFLIGFICVLQIKAQRHFYHRLDVGTSNVYAFAFSNLVTGYANYFTHDILFDNSYVYTLYKGEMNGERVHSKGYTPTGLTAKELFNDSYAGVKLGWQSDCSGSFNWGFYFSGHYRINQIKTKLFDEEYKKERYSYLKPGVGVLLTFGNIESRVKVQAEVALRYDVPIGYKGMAPKEGCEALNKGTSAHFAIKVAGYSWLSAGVFVDINGYNTYNMEGIKFKPYSFGITFTITPKRGEDIYDKDVFSRY